VANKRLNY
jgi:TP901 family phage tail tape measure protein